MVGQCWERELAVTKVPMKFPLMGARVWFADPGRLDGFSTAENDGSIASSVAM